MPRLDCLPPELIIIVADSLSIRDICHWSVTSRYFYGIIMFNETIAKAKLEVSRLYYFLKRCLTDQRRTLLLEVLQLDEPPRMEPADTPELFAGL